MSIGAAKHGLDAAFQYFMGVRPDVADKAMFTGQERTFNFGQNVLWPTAMPDAGVLIDAWLRGADSYTIDGNIKPNQVGEVCRYLQMLGIPLWPSGTINAEARERFHFQGKNAQERNLITNAIAAWNKALEYSFHYPSPETIVRARMARLITPEQFPQMMRRAGAKPEQWRAFEPLIQEHLSINELMTALRRGLIDEDRFKAILRVLGLSDPRELDILTRLRWETPTITDLITFHRRQLDALDLVFQNDYFAGFSPDETVTLRAFNTIFDMRGMDAAQRAPYIEDIHKYYEHIPEGFEDRDFYGQNRQYLQAAGIPDEQALLHFMGAWIIPSPEKCLSFYYKLRDDNRPEWFFNLFNRAYDANNAADVALANKYTYPRSQLIKHLLDSNIVPRDVERYIAAAYNPPSIRFINDLYNNVPDAQPNARNWFLQLGYSPATVDLMAHALEIRRKRTMATQGKGYTPSELQTLFIDGLMDEVRLREHYQYLEFPDEEINHFVSRAYDEQDRKLKRPIAKEVERAFLAADYDEHKASDTLVEAGFTLAYAQTSIAEWKVLKQVKDDEHAAHDFLHLKQEWKKAGEEAYVSNHIDLGTAQYILSNIGMTPDNILLTLRLWEFKREAHLKLPDKGDISKAVKDGVLAPDAAISRLTQVGYTLEDAVYVVLDAWIASQKDLRKQILDGTKSVEQQYQKMLKDAKAKEKTAAEQLKNTGSLPEGHPPIGLDKIV